MKFKQFYFTEQQNFHSFSCAMLSLNPDLKTKIKDFGLSTIPEEVYTEKADEDIHVTVKYGFTFDNTKPIKTIVNDFGSVEIELGRISKFANEEFDVIKLDVYSKKLRQLHELLSTLPNEDKHPVYRPHVTIAYVKPGSCDFLLGKEFFVGSKDVISQITWSTRNNEVEYISLV